MFIFYIHRWDTGTVIHLAAMFKDVPMTQDELQFVIEKLLRLLGELDLQELPPWVYQLLLLASKVKHLNCQLLSALENCSNSKQPYEINKI